MRKSKMRKTMKKKALAALSLAMCIGMMPGTAFAQEEADTAQKSLVISTGGGLCSGGYDPCTGWGMYGYNIFHSMLYKYDKDLNMNPDLATSCEVSEDGLTYTYKIRDDVKFSNGEPLKASDVAFTYLTARDSGSSVDLTMLESAEAPDDTTVIFKLNKPYSVFLQYGAQLGIVPEAEYDENYGEKGIGSGPFKLVQLDMDQQLIIAPNEYYYGTQSPFEQITILNLDADTSLAMAQSGQMDLVYVYPEYSDETVEGMHMETLESVDKLGFNLPVIPSGETNEDGVPLGNDVTSDIAIRKALNIGLDRETIIENGLNGKGTPAYARVTGLPWCVENPEFEDNQVEEACKLLEEAGWVDTDGDGIREKDGLKAEFSLMASASESERYNLAAAVSEDAKKLGIHIIPESKSSDETAGLKYSQPLVNASGSYIPAELVRYKTGSKNNLSSYSNPVVDGYIDQALAAKTPEEANEYWHLMQSDGTTGINEDVTDVWLVRMTQNYFVRDGLDISSSFCYAEHHGMSFANVEEWTYTE